MEHLPWSQLEWDKLIEGPFSQGGIDLPSTYARQKQISMSASQPTQVVHKCPGPKMD